MDSEPVRSFDFAAPEPQHPHAAAIFQLLLQQGQTAVDLIALNDRQNAAIADKRMQMVIEVLDQKQPLVQRLGQFGAEVNALVENDQMDAVIESDLATLRQLQDKVQSVIGTLMRQEEGSRKDLEEIRGEIAEEMKTQTSATAAASAYARMQRGAENR
ncbi:MAG: hypothetical protein AAFP90_22110 [Planctomycetota bacterium]